MNELLFFLLLYKVWIGIGIILCILEIYDNHFFFLPIGIAALLTSLSLFIDEKNIITESNLLSNWGIVLIYFGLLSIISVYVLRYIFHKKIEKNKDVNIY